jgi:hypothetical protein
MVYLSLSYPLYSIYLFRHGKLTTRKQVAKKLSSSVPSAAMTAALSIFSLRSSHSLSRSSRLALAQLSTLVLARIFLPLARVLLLAAPSARRGVVLPSQFRRWWQTALFFYRFCRSLDRCIGFLLFWVCMITYCTICLFGFWIQCLCDHECNENMH